ncbi:hypothetical protein ID866_12917 [Astraeus odoratus]|nr:hypothetical protein ID866_12917 [Astraeus odoratus]
MTIRVWDAHTGSQIGSPFEGHTDSVLSVAFSPDGRWIVSGSFDKTIRVWDAHPGSQIQNSFEGHAGCVESVSFSSDGMFVVSGSLDKQICVWMIGHYDTSHSLCNVFKLYDGVYEWRDLVKVNVDGWIIGPEGKLLLWIPSYYHALFYSPRNTLVIPRGGPELDLSMVVHGDIWQECYIGM